MPEGSAARVRSFFARQRVPLGYVFGVLALWLARPTRATLIEGGLVAAVGEALRIWAAGHLEKGREVTTSGPYAFTRHPLYMGSTVMGIGVAIAAHSLIVSILVIAYLAVTLTAAVTSEEAHLTEKFGREYPAYRTGALSAREERRFSFARAMRNREYRAAIGFAAAFALLAARAAHR